MSSFALSAETLTVDQLTARQRQYWQGFCAENPLLGSPYFTLDFAELMARCRADTRILAISRNGTPAGFLPFHLSRTGVLRPLGGPMGDHHGLVTNDPWLDLSTALRMARPGIFSFHGAIASQLGFAAHADSMQPSWVVDMSDGFEVYWKERQGAEAKAMRNMRARDRKLSQSGAEIVYRTDDRRVEALDRLVAIKRDQYAKTRATDVFRGKWAGTLIYSLMMHRSEALSGVLSTLEIDGELAAAHFGMRSASVLHYWFPVYNPAFSKFGPGLLLFREIARELNEQGVTRIDLGPGDYDFKHRLSNDAYAIASGQIATRSLSRFAITAGRKIDAFAQSLPIGRACHWPAKAMRRLDSVLAIRAI